MQRAIASVGRINEFLRLEATVKESVTAELPKRATAVSFQNVSFAYKDQLSVVSNQLSVNGEQAQDKVSNHQSQNVLNDITFELEPGKVPRPAGAYRQRQNDADPVALSAVRCGWWVTLR